MLARFLLLSLVLPVLPLGLFQRTSGLPRPSTSSSEPCATHPAPAQSEPRPAAEDAALLRSSHWMQQVEREIERAEYSWSSAHDGTYSAPNRAQDLRSRIGPSGLEVVPRDTPDSGVAAPWRLVLRTLSLGRSESDLRPLGEPRPASVENRIDLHYAALSEWYVNDERGIEQGWTVPASPPGRASSPLRIAIEVQGLRARIDGDGRSAVFLDVASKARLRYEGLRAWDAAGEELTARLLRAPAGFAVQVEDEGARYPITIDPVLRGPIWMVEGDQHSSYLGWSVAGAGDVNGDGFDDVIVGAWGLNRAYLYLGSTSGPSLVPDWTAQGGVVGASFGSSVAGAGDVNGDGLDDVIVGARTYSNEGRAFLFLGSGGGLSTAPDWTVECNDQNSLFGCSVAGVGDVNADGFDDVVVGASHFGPVDTGRAFLYLGSFGGPSLDPDWVGGSGQSYTFYGISVAGAGDVNGDGFDDVIVGSPGFDTPLYDEGRAFLYLGSATDLPPVPDWMADGDQHGGELGHSVAGAGDVNGDGFDDVIVGAWAYDVGPNDEGRAYLHLGSASGPSTVPDWTAEGSQPNAQFGTCVSGAGDVNGDGFDELLVGAPWFNHVEEDEGRAYLYLGSPSGPSAVADWIEEPDNVWARFGISLAPAGDVDGDGFADVIVGAYGFSNGEAGEGGAMLYAGHGDVGTKYCTANANSTGAPADVSASGSISSAAGSLVLDASPVPNQSGVFFHGTNQTQVAFGNGFQCTSGDIVRGALIQPLGTLATYTYDNSDARHSLAAYVGSTRHFQYWFRDPMGGGALFNTSNAVSIPILP